MSEPNCPWCGAKFHSFNRDLSRTWECGSWEPLGGTTVLLASGQSRMCRIKQLVAENERLKGMLRLAGDELEHYHFVDVNRVSGRPCSPDCLKCRIEKLGE